MEIMISSPAIASAVLLSLCMVTGCTSQPSQGGSQSVGSGLSPIAALNPDQQKCEKMLADAAVDKYESISVKQLINKIRSKKNPTVFYFNEKYIDPEANKLLVATCVEVQKGPFKSWEDMEQRFAPIEKQVQAYCGGKNYCPQKAK